MSRNINLGGVRARELRQRSDERAERERQVFLNNWPTELAGKEFLVQPTPAKEIANAVVSENGYAYTEDKSLAKLSVSFGGPGGFRNIRRTLPDIFEVTEIVYSGVGIGGLESDS